MSGQAEQSYDETLRRLQRSVDHTAGRVERLESLVVRAGIVLAVLAIGAGLLLPYWTTSVGGEPLTSSILSLGYEGITYRDEDGAVDGASIFLGLCFLVLTAVALATILVLLRAWKRDAPDRLAFWAGAAGWLLLLGTLGAWLVLLAGLAAEEDDTVMHPGIIVFSLGAATAALLTTLPAARDLWTRGGH